MNKKYNRCPITYQLLQQDENIYSKKGLKLLSPKLVDLNIFPYSAKEQLIEASNRSDKMSIQGVQPKLSAKLNIKDSIFEICDNNGKFILKTPNEQYPYLTENEDLSMRLARTVGIETPMHGLLICKDDSFSYFVKRFDRLGHNKKIAVEDFAQLSGLSRETKYNYSMEKLVNIIDRNCTFPMIERKKLFVRVLFNFLIGNDDMHIKNYSLRVVDNNVSLSPGYDFLNSNLYFNDPEDIALPIKGKKRNINYNLLFNYYAKERLMLNDIVIEDIIKLFKKSVPLWKKLVQISFLSSEYKEKYAIILNKKLDQIQLKIHR